MALLTMSLGFSQTNLEDFESAPINFAGFEGLGGANVVANPSVDANNGSATVGELIVTDAGAPWQGANVVMQDNYIDATNPVNAVSVKVYSTSAFTMLARLADGQAGAVEATGDENHTGSGWETLTFTFNEMLDGGMVSNGQYERIAFFPNWNGAGWNDPAINRTVYIDDITAIAGDPVDPPPPLPPAAPLPSAPDGETYSIYNDTNGYTTQFPFAYNFGGGLASEPNLDTGGGTNLAFQLDFSVGGWGAGEGGPDDVSAYNWVSFDYYTDSTILPGFQIALIDNDGAVGEFFYQVGDTGSGDQIDLVVGSWQRVVIPMSYFTGIGFNNTVLFQWNIVPYNFSVVDGDLVYIDNFLLTQNDPTLSTGSVEAAELKVYPNPTVNEWNISSNNQTITSVEVFDVLGKQVMTLNTQGTEVSIDATELNSGLYFARINTPNGSQSFKLVKE